MLFLSGLASLDAVFASFNPHGKIHTHGKYRNQTIYALARRGADALYTMLRDEAFRIEPTLVT